MIHSEKSTWPEDTLYFTRCLHGVKASFVGLLIFSQSPPDAQGPQAPDGVPHDSCDAACQAAAVKSRTNEAMD